jgi:hypothetical protein
VCLVLQSQGIVFLVIPWLSASAFTTITTESYATVVIEVHWPMEEEELSAILAQARAGCSKISKFAPRFL